MMESSLEKMKRLADTGREFRAWANFVAEPAENTESGLYVTGYACRFNEPTVLYSFDGIDYREQVDPGAFNGADMSDVIFNYDHQGKVMARTRNKTLQLGVDDQGLLIRARLDGTEEGRRMYDEIKGGYVDRMSYCYVVDDDGIDYDASSTLATVKRIKKVYDVAAVSIPAYETTSIEARSILALDKEAREKAEAERAEAAQKLQLRKKRLILLSEL